MDENQIAGLLVAFLLVLGAPLIIGIVLLAKREKDVLRWFAGLMTLKPVIATPVWYAIVLGDLYSPSAELKLIAPGVGLTVLITLLCWRVFRDPHTSGAAQRLLLLDTARWVSSWMWSLLLKGAGNPSSSVSCFCSAALVALALPTIFGFVALALVEQHEPRAVLVSTKN
jgi:hypothetical protein